MTVAELAESVQERFPSANVTRATINEFEALRRKDVGIIKLTAFSQVLKIPLFALIADLEQPFCYCDFPGYQDLSNMDVIEQFGSWSHLWSTTQLDMWSGLTETDRTIVSLLDGCSFSYRLCYARLERIERGIPKMKSKDLQDTLYELRDINQKLRECQEDMDTLRNQFGVRIMPQDIVCHSDGDVVLPLGLTGAIMQENIRSMQGKCDGMIGALDGEIYMKTNTSWVGETGEGV